MTREVRAALRVYKMIAKLHRRGYERIRIVPGMSPSGCYYRSSVTSADNVFADHGALAVDWDRVAINTSGNGPRLFDWPDAPGMPIATLARRFVERFPQIAERGFGSDPDYVRWFALALDCMERGVSPMAYDDYRFPGDRRPRWMPTLCDDESRLPMPPPGANARRYFVEREGRQSDAESIVLNALLPDDRQERTRTCTDWTHLPIRNHPSHLNPRG